MHRVLALTVLLACDPAGGTDEKGPGEPVPSEEKAGPNDAGKPPEAKVAEAKPVDGEPTADKPDDTKPADDTPADADVEDAAFFVVSDKGVVTLTKDGFKLVPGSAGGFLAEFLYGADGKLYARTSSHIVRVQTGGMPSVVKLEHDEVGSVSRFDVSKEGAVWTIGSKGVSEWKDGTWKTQSKKDVGLGDEYTVGIALDSAGDPWAATAAAIAHRKDGKWEPAKLPRGKTQYLSRVGRGVDGQVYISTFTKLFRMTGTPGAVKVKTEQYGTVGEFAFAQSTYGVAKAGIKTASIFLPADKAARFTGKDLNIGTVRAVAADTQGRLWASGEGGVAIMGPGEEKVTWKSGSVDLIAGRVSSLVVRGAGPVLPKAGAVKTGGLKGQILRDGKGVAGIKLEMCESPSYVFSRTPCTGAPTHMRGTTDDEGNFSFDDVPLGVYGLAVKSGRGKWKLTTGAALGSKMTEGEVFDVGSIQLK